MTDQRDLDRALRDHYRARVAGYALGTRAGAQVDRVMQQVEMLGQRPGWLVGLTGNGTISAPRVDWGIAWRRSLIIASISLLVLAVAAILVGREPPNPLTRGLLALSLEGDIYFADPDGGSARRILHGDGLRLEVDSWSADGRWLKLRNPSGQSVLLEASSLRTRVVDGSAQWAPHGSSLAVTEGVGQGLGLAIMDPGTGDRRRVATGLGDPAAAWSWSPDATTFAIADGARLRVADSSTGDVHDLEPFGPAAYLTVEGWSPDGRSILCSVRLGAGVQQVARVDVVTGDVAILIEDAGPTRSFPMWSPDGRWLLARVQSDIVRVDASTGEAMVLREHASMPWDRAIESWERASRFAVLHSWSPDGSHVAFEDDGALWVVGVDGTGLTQVSPTRSGPRRNHVWSPDGEWIAYWGSGPRVSVPESLVIVRRDGRESRDVTVDTGRVSPSSPSVNLATRVAWQAVPRDVPRPVLPSAAANPAPTPRAVAPDDPPAGPPADPGAYWTGVAIAGGCRVERFEFATSASSVSTAAPTSCDANVSSETPIWAPGGSGVLFDQMVETDGFRTDRTAVLVRDGAIMIGERPPARVDFGAVWSPDGRWLSGCDSNDRCFMMRPDGGRYRELTGPPSWSRDGSRVAVAGPDGNLLVGRGDGTDLQPIGAFPLPSSWSPDGTRFAFVRDGNVWVVGVDGSGTRAVTRFEIGGVVAATWSPVGDRLLVRRGSSWSIVAVADGASRPLDIPADAWEVTWSPDGEAISFELSPDHGDHVSTLIVQVADGRMVELRSADAATWSPDGRFLAVMSEGEISWTNEYGQEIHATVPVIEVVRADGSGRRTMWTADRDGLYSMTWLP